MKYICSVTLIVFVFVTSSVKAQHSEVDRTRQQLVVLQDSMRSLNVKMFNASSEPERINANYSFIKTLVEALKKPRSFNYEFDSLKAISILTSNDQRFKIFTWNIMNNDGSYRFYGTIQMNNPDGKLQMFPLVDYSHGFKNPKDSVTTNDKWFGAQYYKIIPVTYNVSVPYYILLGWKGNTVKTTKKVIEVLYFKNNKAYFGLPVFEGDKENANAKRIIFQYSRSASMALNYDPQGGMIIFDHLSPPADNMAGKFELYGPDFSYDGFKLLNGKWRLQEDLPLKNLPNSNDKQYINPANDPGAAIFKKK
ncbi:MAG: hypothetical protein JWN56_2847 [Sphingobacteriales bacterium]|nr:hypothetical protein [Sphingobacteriales bacterium]